MEILSTRPDGFPAGLRVLVVDDDPTWLKILEKMLRKCSYEVTTCGLARVALEMLRKRRDRFDIVISDVNMPDMDGFKLLEQVGLEMDLPVIMMSVDGETSRVMKGVQHGACDYLLKPVRMKELKNIWQHVFRKRINEMRDFEYGDGNEDFQMFRNKSDYMDGRNISCGGDLNSLRKRKDATSKELAARHLIDPCSPKRARVVWSVDLHQKFVNAVNQIGFEKVGPKKIMDLMNVPGLTRENVASHLQKYRLYLSRLQKQNEGMASAGTLQPELTKDLMGNLSFPISLGSPPKDSSFQNHPTKHTRDQRTISEADAVNYKIMAPQAEDIKMHLIDGNTCPRNQKAKTNLNTAHFTRSVEKNVEQKLQRSPYAMDNHIWNEGNAQSGKFPGKEQHIFDPLSTLEHIHQLGGSNMGDHLSTFITPASATGWAEPCSLQLKQTLPDCESSYSSSTPATRSAANLISVKLEPRDENLKHLFASSEVNVCSVRSRFPDQYLIDSVECTHRKSNSIEELVVYPSSKDALCSFHGYSSLESPGLNMIDKFRNGSLTTSQAELPDSTCDGSYLDYEYNFEWMGLPATGSGLFT